MRRRSGWLSRHSVARNRRGVRREFIGQQLGWHRPEDVAGLIASVAVQSFCCFRTGSSWTGVPAPYFRNMQTSLLNDFIDEEVGQRTASAFSLCYWQSISGEFFLGVQVDGLDTCTLCPV